MAKNEDEAGFYSGFIASAMMLGRFVSSFHWGKFADRWGRKPALIVGCCSVCSMSLLFGLSTNFVVAVLARFFLGVFNPIWGIAKTLISELVSPEHESRAMGLTTGVWSLGLVFGPSIGGLLANPALLYPGI
jgi:MFS family permease